MADKFPPGAEEENAFLTRMSVKLPSADGDVSIGVDWNYIFKQFKLEPKKTLNFCFD